jgi:hypothetical protein
MKKSIWVILASVAIAMVMTGCGRIGTGNAGLRIEANGTTSQKVEGEGFYTSVMSHVDQYTMKEVAVNLENMTPKAKDNLSLKELDVTVFYKVKSANALRELAVKRTGQSADGGGGLFLPAYHFVESISKSEVADSVSKHDSLTIHTQRNVLESEIKKAVQTSLNESDPERFDVTRVVVRQVLTDPTVEDAIRRVVAKGKEKEAADLQVGIAESLAKATQQTALTLTPAYLQHEYNQALSKFADNKNVTIVLDGSSSGKILNIK